MLTNAAYVKLKIPSLGKFYTKYFYNTRNYVVDKKIIVDISEVFELKKRKQDELDFYQKQLEELQFKMSMITQEIQLTEQIIIMIEHETVIDIDKKIRNKK